MSQRDLFEETDASGPLRLACILPRPLPTYPEVAQAMAKRTTTTTTTTKGRAKGRPKGKRAQLGIPAVAPIGNKGRKFDVEILTRDEVNLLRKQLNTRSFTPARNDAVITLLYRTGMRVSELADLRGVDVTLDGDAPAVRVRAGKKKGLPREIPIDADALAVLRVWKTHRDKVTTSGLAPFFCTVRRTRVQEQYLRAMLHRLAAHAFVGKRVHPHCLRHTFAVELAREGKDVIAIQLALGHKSLATTQTYLRKLGIDPTIRRALEGRPSWAP